MPEFIPYGRQTIEDDDVAAVVEALRAPLLTTGPKVGEYEAAFAEATGAAHAVACNSGTAALHLALLGLDLGPGAAAIVPSLTFVATANAVRMTGAEVVFADVDPDTGLLTPATFANALERAKRQRKLVRAALPVHLNGQCCDMAELATLASKRGVALVEDACHALGVADIGAAQASRAACFSTHPVKAITTGEGGIVTTANAACAERLRRLRSHGITRDTALFRADGPRGPWSYEMHELGWNYRLSDVFCALGISQLAKLGRFHKRRQELAARYCERLARFAPLVRPVSLPSDRHGWHLFAILVDFATAGCSRAAVMDELGKRGIGTQVHYIPVHRQPYYSQTKAPVDLPGADAYYARCLSLPLFPSMADQDVDHIVGALAASIGADR